MTRDNVDKVVKEGLCCSCGVCKSICSKNAIYFHYGKERNTPQVDLQSCISCGLCYDICPGKGIELQHLSESLFSEQEAIGYNRYCGYYVNSYIAHSNNEDIRFHSASGGVVTQFLLYLLRTKVIDGALVVRYQNDDPLQPEPFIATTEAEILSSRGSKYLVLSYDKVLYDLERFDGSVVVVGLPCHIQGIRQLASRKKQFQKKIIGYFAIYCSLTKTKLSMDYYLWRYGLKKESIGRFSFRDDGCLGYMKVESKSGGLLKKVKYEKYWHGTHSFFINDRCSLCVDHFGELSDISFGDIHIDPYKKDTIGISSVITRSSKWDKILIESANVGDIMLQEVAVDEVVKSQPYVKMRKKGAGVRCYMQIRTLTGRENPSYDVKNNSIITMRTYIIEILSLFMRKVGRYRFVWPIIRLLDR